MNWGELKKQIRDLGFEEDESLEEYESIVATAANTSINTIALDVLPILGRYEFTQEGNESGVKKYDMKELTKEDGVTRFYSFAEENPVRTKNYEYGRFGDFEIEARSILVMDGSISGDFVVYYNRIPTVITPNTSNDFEIELDPVVHTILPLLMAYYVWLDDDERKATMYYNMYESLKNTIISNSIITKVEIRGGIL